MEITYKQMKYKINNIGKRERQAYVPASVMVIEVTAQRVMCTSTLNGIQNEEYGVGDTSGWY